MNKSELADILANNHGLTKTKAAEIVNDIFGIAGIIASAVKASDAVSLQGFGVFKAVDRAARTASNPATGGTVQIPAKRVPKFTPGKNFKEVVGA